MANKRPDGDGLVRKRSDGRWEGRIVVGRKEDGKPIYRSVFAKTLSGILGHTNASFTLDTYTHMTTEMQKKASGIVGNFLDEIM